MPSPTNLTVLVGATSPAVNNAAFTFHIDIFLLAGIACFVLAGLPRALARFSRSSLWKNGFILRSAPRRRRNLNRPPPLRALPSDTPSSPLDSASQYSSSRYTPSASTHTPSYTRSFSHSSTHFSGQSPTHTSHARLLRPRAPSAGLIPPHVRDWTNILYPLAPALRYRLDSGFSVGQLLILTAYTAVLVYHVLWRSNPLTDPLRAGFVATGQVPLVYALATKNNILGALLGVGYEKLNYIHRYSGKLIAIFSDIHALGYIYEWSAAGTLSAHFREPHTAWGTVALACVNLLAITSTAYWRRRLHNVFFSSHVLGFTLFLPAVSLHEPRIVPYAVAAGVLYGFDLTMRAFKTRITHARIVPLPGLHMTRLSVPGIAAGWRAGQHVRLRVLVRGMWAEVHPFTIASASTEGEEGEGLVLLCKEAGGWTKRLFEVAKSKGYDGYGEKGREGGRVRVMIEGPYGGPGNTVFSSYSAAMFVVGGSGITFALAAVQELVRADFAGASRVKVIELIWSVQDKESLTPLLPLFAGLLQRSPSPLHISVFYTRTLAPVAPQPDATSPTASASASASAPALPAGLTLAPGRPKLRKVLEGVLARASALGVPKRSETDTQDGGRLGTAKDDAGLAGVVVGVCGPVGLGDDVCTAVGAVAGGGKAKRVGGVEVHMEVFGW